MALMAQERERERKRERERESIPKVQYNCIYSRKFGKGTHKNLKLANAGTILSHVS